MRTGTARSHTPDRSPARTDRPSRSPERAPTARTGAASIGRAYEARGTTEGLDGASVRAAKDTFVAELCARLVKAQLVPAGTTLASPVGANVLARVSAAPALVSTPPASFGALLAAIVGDVDTDGRFDVDALALSRALPGAGASRILDALTAKLDDEALDALVTKIGFDPARRAELPTDVLTLTPPVELGLAGHTELDRWRQQLSLRADAILTDDGTRPGELDAADHVEVVSPSTGAVVAVPFSAVSPQLVEAFRFNLLTARAAELFVERGTMMRFIDPERGDQVNEAFWSVATASTPVGRQTSWELRPGQSAAAAIDDCFGANAQTYATECAHGRTLVRLKGLLDYDRAAEGSDAAGDYAFDARFAATELDRAAATKWLEGFAAARASGATWAEYSAESPPPKIQCTIEISRHWVFGADESELEPLAQLGGGAAAGTSGYFHNYGVSIQGVKEGWVGENVIDVGYRDGTHRWFGHP
ncbi:hypothetical protein L6R52_42640, partial [Myxococcota bacterium]|nr:hypothetical protein [Myxococcota bacterium]